MKRSRFTEEQIAYALRLAESGTPVVDVCRQIGVSEATYYTRKKKYGDLGVTELLRLKMLEDENARLKRIVADLTLDKQILQDVVKKSSEGCPAARAGGLDAGTLQDKCAQVVPAGAAATIGLVSEERGTRSKRPAIADSGVCHGPAPIWLLAGSGHAQTRRLGNRQEAGLPAVSARGLAASDEGQTPQAHQPVAWAPGARYRTKPALEHGLRARSDVRWPGVAHPDGN